MDEPEAVDGVWVHGYLVDDPDERNVAAWAGDIIALWEDPEITEGGSRCVCWLPGGMNMRIVVSARAEKIADAMRIAKTWRTPTPRF